MTDRRLRHAPLPCRFADPSPRRSAAFQSHRVSDATGRTAEKAFTIAVNDLSNPVATTPLTSPALAWGGSGGVVDLITAFDAPLSTGLVATFQLASVQLPNNTPGPLGSGQIRVLLYSQSGQGPP